MGCSAAAAARPCCSRAASLRQRSEGDQRRPVASADRLQVARRVAQPRSRADAAAKRGVHRAGREPEQPLERVAVSLAIAVRVLLSLTPSGLGDADTVTVTSPADETLSVRVEPEPLSDPPDAEYDAPPLTNAEVPEVSVPYAFTLSVWNSGDGSVHA